MCPKKDDTRNGGPLTDIDLYFNHIIEFYRGDPRGMVFDTIPTSQFLSGLIVPISVIMLIYLGRRAGASDPTA